MSDITQDVRQVYPEDTGNANTNAYDPNLHGQIYNDTDNNGLDITNGSYTGQNIVIRAAFLARTEVTDDAGWNLTDCDVIFDGNTGAQDDVGTATLNGDNRFVRCNFYRNESGRANTDRLLFGNFQTNAAGTNSLTIDSCKFMAVEAPITIINRQIDGTFNFNNNRLIGGIGFEAAAGFRSAGTVWAGLGATGGAGGSFFLRSVHFAPGGANIPNGNVDTTGNTLPSDNAIFCIGDDFSQPIEGGIFIQANGNGAIIGVNNVHDGRQLQLGTGSNVNTGAPAGYYQMIGWKPEWRDAASNEIVTDVRIRSDRRMYEVRPFDADTNTTLDDFNTRNHAPNTFIDLNANNANYRGLWLQTNITAQTSANNTTSRIPAPVNANYRAKSFTHFLDEPNQRALPTVNVTNAIGNADSHFGSPIRGIDDFVEDVRQIAAEGVRVNGFTDAATARAATADTATDIYPILKGLWYQDAVLNVLTDALEWNGTTLSIKRGITFSASTSSWATTFSVQAGSSMDGDGITVDFRDGTTDQNVTWGPVDEITNFNISGGNHNQFPPVVTNVNFTNRPTLNAFGLGQSGNITRWTATGRIDLTSTIAVTVTCTSEQATELFGLDLDPGEMNTAAFSNVTIQVPAAASFTRTYQVPSTLRNGVFGVRNIDTDVELVAPIVIDAGNPATYSYAIDGGSVGTDTIRYYWRPESTATNGYNTTIFDYSVATQGAITADGTQNLNPNEIPSVLWGDVINTNIGNASMSLIEDGDEDLGGIDRAELRFVNSVGILNDAADGAARTLYAGITALNGDVDYLNRMIDNELTTDYITSGGSDLQVDGRYCYLHSGDSSQQIVTAVSRVGGGLGTDANFIPKTFTFTSGGTAPSVVILPNPEGATPGQISAGVNAGVGNAITPLENAVGYLVDNDASQIALERNENFDKTTTTYRDNVR